jgi:hypothetical protein
MKRSRHIANTELRIHDVPPVNVRWGAIERFALTFNAYAHGGSIRPASGANRPISAVRLQYGIATRSTTRSHSETAVVTLRMAPVRDRTRFIACSQSVRGRPMQRDYSCNP